MISTVLIVDDEPINCFIVEQLCKKAKLGNQFLSIQNADECVTYLESLSSQDLPDIIFLDINMPLLTGWEIIDKTESILNSKKELKIVLLTSSILESDKHKANEHPLIHSFIMKPLDMAMLQRLQSDLENTSNN